MNTEMNLKPNKAFWIALIIIFLTGFLILAGYKAQAQTIQKYYTSQLCLYRTNGDVIKDVWLTQYDFDAPANHLIINVQQPEGSLFTIIYNIYGVQDIFDQNERLIKTKYLLSENAILYIIPEYPEDGSLYMTGYYYKLIDPLQGSYMKKDYDKAEIRTYIPIY